MPSPGEGYSNPISHPNHGFVITGKPGGLYTGCFKHTRLRPSKEHDLGWGMLVVFATCPSKAGTEWPLGTQRSCPWLTGSVRSGLQTSLVQWLGRDVIMAALIKQNWVPLRIIRRSMSQRICFVCWHGTNPPPTENSRCENGLQEITAMRGPSLS